MISRAPIDSDGPDNDMMTCRGSDRMTVAELVISWHSRNDVGEAPTPALQAAKAALTRLDTRKMETATAEIKGRSKPGSRL